MFSAGDCVACSVHYDGLFCPVDLLCDVNMQLDVNTILAL